MIAQAIHYKRFQRSPHTPPYDKILSAHRAAWDAVAGAVIEEYLKHGDEQEEPPCPSINEMILRG